jgi:hypothetical protein
MRRFQARVSRYRVVRVGDAAAAETLAREHVLLSTRDKGHTGPFLPACLNLCGLAVNT